MSLGVLLIIPDRFFRLRLTRQLAAVPQISISGGYDALPPVLSTAHVSSVDILLVDAETRILTDGQGMTTLLDEFPRAELVLLGPEPDAETLLSLLRAGASGYLPRTIALDGLVKALHGIERGEAPLTRAYAGLLTHALHREDPHLLDASDMRRAVEQLSQREREILRYIQQGYSNQEIAVELVVAMSTVKTHVSNILTKTGHRSRHQLQSLYLDGVRSDAGKRRPARIG